ncbi:MAG: hypothetical protein IJ191_03395 [Treponema sp.]|nr:hypothetical protein [Treponema sp.]
MHRLKTQGSSHTVYRTIAPNSLSIIKDNDCVSSTTAVRTCQRCPDQNHRSVLTEEGRRIRRPSSAMRGSFDAVSKNAEYDTD